MPSNRKPLRDSEICKMTTNTDIDQGYAWLVLFASFMMRILTEGFWSSLGILLVEWQEYFDASARDVAVIGSIALVVILVSAPFAAALSNRLSFRIVGIVGGGMTSIFMFATSYANELWLIYVTVAFAGIGLGLGLQIGCVFCVFYFDKRLGFANGVCCSGAAIGALCMPPLFQALMEGYGWRGGTLVISAIMANMCMCAALLKSSSLMPGKQSNIIDSSKITLQESDATNSRSIWREFASDFDFSLWRNVRFIFAALMGFMVGMGYTTTVIYIVPYADDVGINKMKSSLLISIMGLGSLVGRLANGRPIDNGLVLPSHLGAISWFISGITILAFPFTDTYVLLTFLMVVFGISSGVGNALTFMMIKNAVGPQKSSNGYAWFLLIEGPGCVVGIYLSGYLYDVTGTYRPALLLTGTGILCASVCTLADYFIERWQLKLKNPPLEYIVTTQVESKTYTALGETAQNNLKIVVMSQNDQRHKLGSES